MLPNYRMDEFGVIHQIEFTPIAYDQEYLTYYENLSERTIKLGYQRLGWVLGKLDQMPASVLEIGYGTGTFIEAAKIAGVPLCAGCDIADYPLPEGVEFHSWERALAKAWELVAMFDVLEHIPDLGFLAELHASYVVLAVPWCRYLELGDDWFQTWRMRLPNEHLHHFDEHSLPAFMSSHGYECLNLNSFEDGLRLREGEVGPNILCGLFKRMA